MDFINIELFGGRINCYKHALKSVINNPNDPNPKDVYEHMLAEVEQKSGVTLIKCKKLVTNTQGYQIWYPIFF